MIGLIDAVLTCSRRRTASRSHGATLPWLGVRLDMPNEVGGGIPHGADEAKCTILIPGDTRHQILCTPWCVAIITGVWNYNLLNEPTP